jgi:hypothetical protein
MMKYGQIAGNNNINAMIYRCFEYISEEDERKFVKKFQEQPDDSDQIMHTFRELILGAYLCSRGFKARHDYVINNKTPDWSILDADGAITGIVELTNFHIDKTTENEIEEQMRARGIATYWRDQNKDNVDRLYRVIRYKAAKYSLLVEELQTPYVVSVFGEFEAAVDFEEVCLCLFDKETGLFGMYPELSGVLYFEEGSGQYSFNYAGNPNTLRTIELPIGIFPPEAA